MMKLKKSNHKGFTIIELMIATAVLSTLLVTVSIIMISIGNLYYKGVNQARVQDDTRNVLEQISQHLELSSDIPLHAGPVANGTQAYCVGTTRYTYVIGVQIGTSGFKHILWRDTIHSASVCGVATLTATDPSLNSDAGSSATGGTELITPNSRLINFSINPLTSPYMVTVGIAYGDDDLFCSPSVGGSCATDAAMTGASDYSHGDLHCKARLGDQFCSTSNLSTTVVQRLTVH